MTRLYLILLFAVGLTACGDHPRQVEIWIENNSDSARVVAFSTYMDDSLVDRRRVVRDSIADLIRSFVVTLPGVRRPVRFRFVADSTHRETSCLVNPDSIRKSAFLNVVYVDRIMRGRGLGPDSVLVDTAFGCKVYYHGLKPE